jgi:urease subunit alpha
MALAGQQCRMAAGWRPSAYFGVRPELILKSGHLAWGAMGEGNASVEDAEPRRYGAHWGSLGNAPPQLSVTFVSQQALDDGVARKVGSRRRFTAVRGTRSIRRADLIARRACPQVDVDNTDGSITLDGRTLAASPVSTVPISRRYLLA